MKTTTLYVELVVIGVQTSIWIVLLPICFIEHSSFFQAIEKMPPSILVSLSALALVLFYIIGIIFDLFAEMVFRKRERKIRKKCGFAPELGGKSKKGAQPTPPSSTITGSTSLIWREHPELFRYHRTRYRILRATVINAIITWFPLSAFIIKHIVCKYECAIPGIFIFWLTTVLLFGCSYVSYRKYPEILKKYYKRTKELYEEQQPPATP